MNNTKKNDLLFLWTFRWKNQLSNNKDIVQNQNFNWHDIEIQDDYYFQYSRELIKNNFIDKANFCFFDARFKKEIKEIYPKIFVYIFPSIESCLKDLEGNYKLLITRGNFDEFNPLLDTIKKDVSIFYAGYREFIPTYIPIEKFDIIWVDSLKQLKIGKNKFPNNKWVFLKKTVNSNIFYNDKNIEKKYDICYPAQHFAPFKNHELLFSSISRMKNKKDITVICPGKYDLKFSLSEVNLWAKMHDINVSFPGFLSSDDLAQTMRQSKIGVIPSEKEGNPRIITEMIACGLPIVANKNLSSGLDYITSQTGVASSLDNFTKNLEKLLKNYKKYSPEKYFIKNLSSEKVVKECLIDPATEILRNKISI